MKKRGVGRKGQVTAFIIVGILLLVSISAVMYLRGRAVKKEGIDVVTEARVSIGFAPAYLFVTSCIDEITKEGKPKTKMTRIWDNVEIIDKKDNDKPVVHDRIAKNEFNQ